MHPLTFLETYKDQLGILLSAALLVATCILIIVGLLQALAARFQAKIGAMQLEEGSRPLLLLAKNDSNLDWFHPEQVHRVRNDGYGVAQKIKITSDDASGNSVLDAKVDLAVVLPVGQSIPLALVSRHHFFEYSARGGKRYCTSITISRSGPESVFIESSDTPDFIDKCVMWFQRRLTRKPSSPRRETRA